MRKGVTHLLRQRSIQVTIHFNGVALRGPRCQDIALDKPRRILYGHADDNVTSFKHLFRYIHEVKLLLGTSLLSNKQLVSPIFTQNEINSALPRVLDPQGRGRGSGEIRQKTKR